MGSSVSNSRPMRVSLFVVSMSKFGSVLMASKRWETSATTLLNRAARSAGSATVCSPIKPPGNW